MLFDVIQTITGSPINQKSFRLWKGDANKLFPYYRCLDPIYFATRTFSILFFFFFFFPGTCFMKWMSALMLALLPLFQNLFWQQHVNFNVYMARMR